MSKFCEIFEAWRRSTQDLPFRRQHRLPAAGFELDLSHLIDHFELLGSEAAQGSTKYDYQLLAQENLKDLNIIQTGLDTASLRPSDKDSYIGYISLFRTTIQQFGSLPVSAEGHLGFRGQAIRTFAFLLEEYGFELSRSSPTSVQFVKPTIVVEVSYWPEFPMNSVTVRRSSEPEDSPNMWILDDFAYADGQGILFDYEQFDLYTRTDIARFLQCAASIVRRRGSLLLSGDEAAAREFDRLARKRERAYIELMEREQQESD